MRSEHDTQSNGAVVQKSSIRKLPISNLRMTRASFMKSWHFLIGENHITLIPFPCLHLFDFAYVGDFVTGAVMDINGKISKSSRLKYFHTKIN